MRNTKVQRYLRFQLRARLVHPNNPKCVSEFWSTKLLFPECAPLPQGPLTITQKPRVGGEELTIADK